MGRIGKADRLSSDYWRSINKNSTPNRNPSPSHRSSNKRVGIFQAWGEVALMYYGLTLILGVVWLFTQNNIFAGMAGTCAVFALMAYWRDPDVQRDIGRSQGWSRHW